MTDFLSKISGQITGQMIIGTLFPIILFLAILVLVVLPVTPYGHQYTDLLKDPQNWKGIDAVVATLIVLLATVVLYQLNNPLIRLYEGYSWKQSLIGWLLCRRQKKHWNHIIETQDRIFKLRQGKRLENVQGELLEDVNDARIALIREAMNQYPHREDLILPTRLGNLIRAFETYTNRQYKADAIVLWPRLQGVMDANFAQAVDGVKSGFDFMLNVSFLSAVLSLLLAVAGLHWRHPSYYGWLQPWEFWMVFFAGTAWLAYQGAINRAREWGISVKAAFDLYRLALLPKLGYEIKPADLSQERKFWEVIGYHFSFPGDGLCCDLPYRAPQTFLMPDPPCAKLTLARTVHPISDSLSQIQIIVTNLDPTRLGVDGVAVKDQIPDRYAYLSGSALLDGQAVALLEVNPLSVQLGALPYNQAKTLVYDIKAQPKA